MRRPTLVVVLFALLAFATSALAKPSDWDDVLEKPGDKSALPRPSQNAPDVVSNARTTKPAKATSAKHAKQAKKAKAKKAPRRAKAKRSRR